MTALAHPCARGISPSVDVTGQPAWPSLEICEDCEDEIPAERRKKQPGCTRCVACQSVYERLRGGL
ncbi:MAG: TraR/DksA C4-type zinc finger protein [Rhodanobacter sp.]